MAILKIFSKNSLLLLYLIELVSLIHIITSKLLLINFLQTNSQSILEIIKNYQTHTNIIIIVFTLISIVILLSLYFTNYILSFYPRRKFFINLKCFEIVVSIFIIVSMIEKNIIFVIIGSILLYTLSLNSQITILSLFSKYIKPKFIRPTILIFIIFFLTAYIAILNYIHHYHIKNNSVDSIYFVHFIIIFIAYFLSLMLLTFKQGYKNPTILEQASDQTLDQTSDQTPNISQNKKSIFNYILNCLNPKFLKNIYIFPQIILIFISIILLSLFIIILKSYIVFQVISINLAIILIPTIFISIILGGIIISIIQKKQANLKLDITNIIMTTVILIGLFFLRFKFFSHKMIAINDLEGIYFIISIMLFTVIMSMLVINISAHIFIQANKKALIKNISIIAFIFFLIKTLAFMIFIIKI